MTYKIEISPKEYWIERCSYDEAILYCFSLEIDGKKGWRIFKMKMKIHDIQIMILHGPKTIIDMKYIHVSLLEILYNDRKLSSKFGLY
jgi:hypothetical protein